MQQREVNQCSTLISPRSSTLFFSFFIIYPLYIFSGRVKLIRRNYQCLVVSNQKIRATYDFQFFNLLYS